MPRESDSAGSLHTVTRYLKALVRTEDPFYVLGNTFCIIPTGSRTVRSQLLTFKIFSKHLMEGHFTFA